MKSASLITGRPTAPKTFFSSALLIYHFSEYIQILAAAILVSLLLYLSILYYLASEEKKYYMYLENLVKISTKNCVFEM